MIVCGWCDSATEPGRCSQCGRDPALPWIQRAQEPPQTHEGRPRGRPPLNPAQTRHKLRLAYKELGNDATKTEVAEYLDIDVKTLSRWEKVSS